MIQTDGLEDLPEVDNTARRHSMAVAVVVAVCATLVVAMVFAMADRTQAVANDANVVHGIDLASSHVDRVSHGIGAAAILSTTDPTEAATRLVRVEEDLATAEAIVGSATAADVEELADFVVTARQTVDGIKADPPPADIDSRLDLLVDQSAAVTDRYAEMSTERLEAIGRAERLLSRFGALGGGAVAFVIPVLAIYLHLRLRDGEQQARNATIAYRWRLSTTEQRFRRVLNRLATGLELLDIDELAGRRLLRTTLAEGDVDQGRLVLKPEPTDLEDLLDREPELPGLQRRAAGLAAIRCIVDPATFAAALTSIESAMVDAGADAVDITLAPSSQSDAAELRISAQGIQATVVSDPRTTGSIPTIRTLLASGGLDHTIDESGSTWTLYLPVEPDPPGDTPEGEQSSDDEPAWADLDQQ